MELRHLRYFSAVAEELCFRKAAEQLRVSHPSLCRQIIELEDELGTKLFWRNHHRVVLTESGRTFLEGARRTLKCASQTIERTRQTAQDQNGELRIASIGLGCTPVLVYLIRAFREQFPGVQVSILDQNDCNGFIASREQAQLGIGYLPSGSRKPKVGTLKNWVVASAPVGIAATAGITHKNGGAASLRDFGDTPFVILDSRGQADYLPWVRLIFRQTGFKPAQTLKVNSAEAFFALLRAGAGAALLTQLHFQAENGNLCFRKLTDALEKFPLSLIWDACDASPLVNHFLGVVRQVLPIPNRVLWEH